jgi:hypothetical protein
MMSLGKEYEPVFYYGKKVHEENPILADGRMFRGKPYLYIRNRAMSVLVKTRMDELQKNFWMGAGLGAVIIIIIDLLVPFLGPFIGGFTAGYIAKGDLLTDGKAGLLAGILAAIVVSGVVFAGMVSHPAAGYIPGVGTGFFLYIVISLYLAVIAFLGGAIAGAVRK